MVIRVTVHHSYFRAVTARNPKLRFGRVHHFNNVIEDWKGPAIEIAYGGQLRIEGTAFLPDPKKSKLAVQSQSDAPGSVVAVDLLNNGQPVEENLPEQVFVPPYPYPLEKASSAMVERVRAEAGWQALGAAASNE